MNEVGEMDKEISLPLNHIVDWTKFYKVNSVDQFSNIDKGEKSVLMFSFQTEVVPDIYAIEKLITVATANHVRLFLVCESCDMVERYRVETLPTVIIFHLRKEVFRFTFASIQNVIKGLTYI
ncbi:hypothetical protein EIN_080160 [Entamoeba invadens IP1]|uniref:hypothetical protein n=1 Tax=Entamoeba invadens IP1 TaxID=370355 RepID=UPI0002C3D674|nr:hypothetical protein EIN_080160 [Entamoeba invadens IP1]ELP85064.1 hypothetical protein EIN_080160 [Entamoeba invadens IP1]|eukprot:XP_004184410.1 hypothetical protein EIN_080160 [Entamoeba invadens IP1]